MGLRDFTTTNFPLGWAYAGLRIAAPGGGWRFESFGYCTSCDRSSMFVLAKRHAAWVEQIAADWDNDNEYKRSLAIRESNICALCRANLRMRAQARTVLDVLGLRNTAELAALLGARPAFAIFEAATNTVFRVDAVVDRRNYVRSEYRESAPRGAIVDGVMNQDLHALTFDDASVDVVLTSDVLEHVADLDRSLDEIGRVLKPGGHHIFTVPTDVARPQTVERAHLSGGAVVHDLPPVYHGDSMRGDGILAFRDFGADAIRRLSRPDMPCSAVDCTIAPGCTATVYVAKKGAGAAAASHQ